MKKILLLIGILLCSGCALSSNFSCANTLGGDIKSNLKKSIPLSFQYTKLFVSTENGQCLGYFDGEEHGSLIKIIYDGKKHAIKYFTVIFPEGISPPQEFLNDCSHDPTCTGKAQIQQILQEQFAHATEFTLDPDYGQYPAN